MSVTAQVEYLQARTLRNLYFTRTAVQLIWAGVVISIAAANPGLATGLLILYPLWDVACTVYDLKSLARINPGSATTQYVNMVLGSAAAIGIALTAFRSPQRAVVIFGVWAFAAGLAQLAVGLARRKQLGGQWAMILSGVQSAAAGLFFILGGLHGTKHIADLGRYAIFGGVYFFIAAVLMHRKLPAPAQGIAR